MSLLTLSQNCFYYKWAYWHCHKAVFSTNDPIIIWRKKNCDSVNRVIWKKNIKKWVFLKAFSEFEKCKRSFYRKYVKIDKIFFWILEQNISAIIVAYNYYHSWLIVIQTTGWLYSKINISLAERHTEFYIIDALY